MNTGKETATNEDDVSGGNLSISQQKMVLGVAETADWLHYESWKMGIGNKPYQEHPYRLDVMARHKERWHTPE